MGLGPSSNPQADAPSPALDISSDALPIDRRVVPSTPTSAMLSGTLAIHLSIYRSSAKAAICE